jgi:hypothetical protein
MYLLPLDCSNWHDLQRLEKSRKYQKSLEEITKVSYQWPWAICPTKTMLSMSSWKCTVIYLSVDEICHSCHETSQKVWYTTLCSFTIFSARLHKHRDPESIKDAELNRSDKTVHMRWVWCFNGTTAKRTFHSIYSTLFESQEAQLSCVLFWSYTISLDVA